MIILYIFLGILAFLLLFLAMTLFIPSKTRIQASFWDGDLNATLELYWIKYFFGARIRLLEMEKLKILIWFLGIPIPIKLSLKNDKEVEKEESDLADEIISVDEKKSQKKEASKKKDLREKIEDIIKIKDELISYIRKNWTDIKNIFVSYVTFSFEHLELELGMGDPAKTGKMAGNLYTIMQFLPLKNVKLSWDFAKQRFNIDIGIKIIMKFYGILLTLLKLYRAYKRK